MKSKLLVLLITPLFLLGCASTKKVPYHVAQSAWATASVGEVNGISGSVVTSLFFTSSKDVTIMTSVANGDSILVRPFVFAKGTYKVEGNPKKEAKISLDVKTIDGKDMKYTGKYKKIEGMLLETQTGKVLPFAYINKLNTK